VTSNIGATAMEWFILGFLVAMFLNMITTTPPQRARENLSAWLDLVRRKPNEPSP